MIVSMKSGLVLTLLLVLAASIAVACVVGRYHYVIDVVAGIALTLVIWFFVT